MKKTLLILLTFIFSNFQSIAQLQGTFTTTINTICNGNVCEYEGPSILINEIQITPSGGFNGSISGPNGTSPGRGEWIELYNPNICEPVDISCYYLGNAVPDGGTVYGGGFQLPAGTIIPPAGFCLVRGTNAPAVPSHLKVENGGNVVEVIVPGSISGDGICVSSGGGRLWFPDSGGWFAFYDNNGVPQDAISWGSSGGVANTPCIPVISGCNTGVTSLVSYNNIPADRKNHIFGASSSSNNTIRRMPDGGAWVTNQKAPATMGECNDPAQCAQAGVSSCDGVATINVTGGSGNYSYQWNDSQAQMTQTATALCEGTYEVVVTDLDNGVSETFTVYIDELEITYTSSSTSTLCGDDNGTITLAGADGAAPYSYSIDNGDNYQADHEFSNLASGTYNIVVEDDNGCTVSGTEIVAEIAGVEIDAIDNVDLVCFGVCEGEVSVVASTGGTIDTYDWTDASGNSVGNTATVEDLCAGVYTVEVTDDNGCAATESITIHQPADINPSFELTDFCGGEQNSASNIAETGGTFAIISPAGDGASVDPTTGAISNGVEGTTYTIEYSFPNGCASHTETVTVNENPIINAINGTDPICFGACDGEVVALISSGTTPYNYSWTDATGNTVGGNASVAEDLCDGTYTVEITDANGCQTSGSVTITEPEEIDPYFELTDFCGGEQNNASNIAETGGTFSIASPLGDGATIDPITGEIYDGVEGTTYTIDYSFPNGCASHTEDVTVNVIPVVSFVADTIAGPPPLVVEFTNTSTGADEYVWDFGDGNGSLEDDNVVNVYNNIGTYEAILVGASLEGCTHIDSLTIVVYYPDMDYVFPNVFTPNGDNNNDWFTLAFEDWVASLEIVILNRWGNVVFESDDINFMWNGKVHNTGTDCTEGVYFYKATLTDYSGESVQEHGYVHLHR